MFKLPDRRRIYLMRHGEAAYVSPEGIVTNDPRNVPLTNFGREQATQQGQMLAEINIDRAICSGLPRTRETIGLVMAQLTQSDLPELEIFPDLEEIHGLKGERKWPPSDGSSTESVLAEIANPWARGAEPGARFLGGEEFEGFSDRVVQQWERIVNDTAWENLLLVLHGAVNRAIFNHLLGLTWSGQVCIEQDNACLNIIDVDAVTPRRYLVRAINITSYNLSKLGDRATNMESTALRIATTL